VGCVHPTELFKYFGFKIVKKAQEIRWNMSDTYDNEQGLKPKVSFLAIAALISSVLIIPFLAIGVYRTNVAPNLSHYDFMQKYGDYPEQYTLPLGISARNYYRLDKFNSYSFTVPLLLGIAALVRIRFSRGRLYGKAIAKAGIILVIISLFGGCLFSLYSLYFTNWL
jgi:hypothetical protein